MDTFFSFFVYCKSASSVLCCTHIHSNVRRWLIWKDNNKSWLASACGYAHWPSLLAARARVKGQKVNASMQSSSSKRTNCHYGLTASLSLPIVCLLLLHSSLLFFSFSTFLLSFLLLFVGRFLNHWAPINYPTLALWFRLVWRLWSNIKCVRVLCVLCCAMCLGARL